VNECFFGLQDLESAYREGDAARRNLRDVKEAQVQALHAQSAAYDQTMEDAKTVAAQVLPTSPAQMPLLSRLAVFARPMPQHQFSLMQSSGVA
jgi:hypothetical protein